MGRPKCGTNTNHSKEEKLALVLQNLNGETIHYFNYIKPMRKLKRKPPVQYRLEQAA